MAEDSGGSPILHVVVVGFHHKKGCQVEFSYPPLIEGNCVESHDLPEEWKHLPSLALPDGAHNFTKDTTYFHLVSRDGTNSTVYGISCYRQMDSKDLINRTADVTRSSVQKSVCVLSRLPLYGAIQAKLELITHAYFKERDFSHVSLLHETLSNLVASFPVDTIDPSLTLHGLKPCDIVLTFRHKILVLFKLLLLERRVMVYGTPVYLCSNMVLSLLSLFPEMIEHGLSQSTAYPRHNQLSPTMRNLVSDDESDFMEIHYHESSPDEGHMTRDTSCDAGVEWSTEKEAERGPTDGGAGVVAGGDFVGQPGPRVFDKGDGYHAVGGELMNKHTGVADGGGARETSASHDAGVDCSGGEVADDRLTVNTPDDESAVFDNREVKTSIIYDASNDPLADLGGITSAESVQSETDVRYSRDETTALQTEGTGVHRIRIPSLEELQRIDSEEIDSPQSIDRIDREDCFSWDDDSLMLEIDHELGRGSERTASSSTFYVDLEGPVPDERAAVEIHPDTHESAADVGGDVTLVGDDDGGVQAKDDVTIDGRTIRNRLVSAFASLKPKPPQSVSRFKHLSDCEDSKNILNPDQFGFPLAIFTKGSLCHPYLCLQYYDLLQDVNIRSFFIGASNVLFKQKTHLVDAIVDVAEARLDIHDPELRKQLALSTADLRFSDQLVKTVTDSASSSYLLGTEWEGGNEWLRAQFRVYLQSLLAASIHPDSKYLEDYHPAFVSAWSTTRNYRVWQKLDHSVYANILPSHPCHGNLTVTDLKVKWTSTLQSTDRGRRLNSAVSQTGKYVVQTGKVVGGAISSAKSAVSSWFNSFTSD